MMRREVLITGGASGIGLECGAVLAEAGWAVHLADLNPHVHDVAAQVGATGTVVDVRRTEEVDAWTATYPLADALVTSAGVCSGSYLVDSSDAEWESILDINLMGTVRTLRAFARHRIEAGAPGVACLIASNNAFWAARSISQYCASKAAIVMLGKTAASELGEHAIRVNVVAPGETETPMTAQALTDVPADLAEIERRTPLGRIGQPRDIATAVRALLSDDAAWITGQLISVDGGISLRGESDFNPVHQVV